MSGGPRERSSLSRPRNGHVDGILNIDKPPGMTSMDVVRRVKRAIRQKRVGHGGTLDPIATGVIAIFLGQATRMMDYLIEGAKEYRGTVELGVETDTYDTAGEVTATGDASSVTMQDIENALVAFRGAIRQVPPMYSALKRDGKRLYELARAGVEVEREARKVEVMGIKLLDWTPPVVELTVTCGRGFYMRSLAHDLGRALGCGGHLKSLVRLRNGPFKVSEAMTLEDAEQSLADGDLRDSLHAPDTVVSHMGAAIVGKRLEETIRSGRPMPQGLRIPSSMPAQHCRVYGTDGRFVAIMTFDASLGQWQPRKVFNISY